MTYLELIFMYGMREFHFSLLNWKDHPFPLAQSGYLLQIKCPSLQGWFQIFILFHLSICLTQPALHCHNLYHFRGLGIWLNKSYNLGFFQQVLTILGFLNFQINFRTCLNLRLLFLYFLNRWWASDHYGNSQVIGCIIKNNKNFIFKF